jgi:hypothetical protein
MTTMEADPNTSRLAAMRGSLTGAEWTRVAAMVGVIAALHLFGWVTLAAFVAPHHFSVGGKALGMGLKNPSPPTICTATVPSVRPFARSLSKPARTGGSPAGWQMPLLPELVIS